MTREGYSQWFRPTSGSGTSPTVHRARLTLSANVTGFGTDIVPFDQVDLDSDNYSGPNVNELTIPTDQTGVYVIEGQIQMSTGNTSPSHHQAPILTLRKFQGFGSDVVQATQYLPLTTEYTPNAVALSLYVSSGPITVGGLDEYFLVLNTDSASGETILGLDYSYLALFKLSD